MRFGEGNAEGRGSGSGRLTLRLPAGAKQKEAAHGAVRRQQRGGETNMFSKQNVADETADGAIGPSKEVSRAVRRRSPGGTPKARWGAAFGPVVPPF